MELSDKVDNKKSFTETNSLPRYPLPIRAFFVPGYMIRWALNSPKEIPLANLLLTAVEFEVGKAMLYAGVAYMAYEAFK